MGRFLYYNSHSHSYLPLAGGNLTGNITADVGITLDGVDLSVLKTTFDAVKAAFDAMASNINIYQCSAALTLTTSAQDVVGCTTGLFTPTVNEVALVDVSAQFNYITGTAVCQVGDLLVGLLNLRYSSTDHNQATGINLTVLGTAAVGTAIASGTANVVRFYKLSLTAGTQYEIKVTGYNATGARGQIATTTMMKVWRLPA